jgi:hypothetical protein
VFTRHQFTANDRVVTNNTALTCAHSSAKQEQRHPLSRSQRTSKIPPASRTRAEVMLGVRHEIRTFPAASNSAASSSNVVVTTQPR